MKFSVAMCVWNGDNSVFFNESIKSIIQNTLTPDEIVIVVDGIINDRLERVLSSYKSRLNVVRLDKNRGHAYARNVSVNNCSNELIALMDSDDICKKDRFERQIKYFNEHPDTDVLGGQIVEFSEKISNTVSMRLVPIDQKKISQKIKYTNPVNNVTLMYKKSAFLSVGGYDTQYFPEDWFFLIKLYEKKFKIVNLDDVACYVRVSGLSSRRSGIKYFKNLTKVYLYLLRKRVINFFEFIFFVSLRFVFHVCFSDRLRARLYKIFLRK